jgi:signal transduction histidine kinase
MDASRVSVLLVDDNSDDRELAKRAIRKGIADATFIEIETEADFSRALIEFTFTVAIIDYRLGWTDGLCLLDRLKKHDATMPVIMFTNTGTEDVCAQGMKAGLFDYIIKRREQFPKLPVSIRAALEFRRTREELQWQAARLSELLERERRARAEAEIARVEAERANRLKDEFLATVSHELRTPLNAVLGWAALMSNDKFVDMQEIRRGLKVIEKNARVQAQLIDDLLDLSLIVSGRIRLEIDRIDLVSAVQSAIEAVRVSAGQKGIEITQVLDPKAGPVRGDTSRLQQIVWNLLTNAVKFTPEGGKIHVVVRRVSSRVAISVTDSGIGIRQELLPIIFEQFRQGDNSLTRKYGGLGIGLAVVKNLVELHGGYVEVHSAGEGQGATFTVSLPVCVLKEDFQETGDQRPGLAISGEVAAALAGLRVLVVEDDLDTADLVARVLREYGIGVEFVLSTHEALGRLKEGRFDVLLSDIGMPGQSGYALIADVRALPPRQNGSIPAAALTALARSEDRQRALLAGFDTHLAKPVDPNELIALVASLSLRSRRRTN